MRHKPADEDTSEEANDRQEQLAGDEVEEIEHRHTEELVVMPGTQREGTDDTHDDTTDGDYQRCPFSGGAKFLFEEGGAHLMEGDQRRKGCHRQQGVEKHGDNIAQARNTSEGLLEHVRQGDEDERWTAVGLHTDREGCREDDQSSQYGHQEVDDANLYGRLREVGLTGEIAGVGTDTAHGNAQRIERLA